MAPGAPRFVLLASLVGFLTGALVLWIRKRPPRLPLVRWAFLIAGTSAFVYVLVAFTKAFGNLPILQAITVTILVTSWSSVVNAIVPLPFPRCVLQVRPAEFELLRAPATGVRAFVLLLRKTPLRHLGGRVFLDEDANRSPAHILPGVLAAETVHIWAVLLSGPWLIFWLAQQQWPSLLAAMAVHVTLNLYPILHLRYVSWRLQRCIARQHLTKPLSAC